MAAPPVGTVSPSMVISSADAALEDHLGPGAGRHLQGERLTGLGAGVDEHHVGGGGRGHRGGRGRRCGRRGSGRLGGRRGVVIGAAGGGVAVTRRNTKATAIRRGLVHRPVLPDEAQSASDPVPADLKSGDEQVDIYGCVPGGPSRRRAPGHQPPAGDRRRRPIRPNTPAPDARKGVVLDGLATHRRLQGQAPGGRPPPRRGRPGVVHPWARPRPRRRRRPPVRGRRRSWYRP